MGTVIKARLIERMTLRSADADGKTLNEAAIRDLGAWGGMDYTVAPDSEGFHQTSFDRHGIVVREAAHMLAAFGDNWQVVLTYWAADVP